MQDTHPFHTTQCRQEREHALLIKPSRWTINPQIPGAKDYGWGYSHLWPGGQAGVKVFGKLGHSKANVYIIGFRKIHTCPHQKLAKKRPKKTRFHLGMILRLRAILAKW